MMKEERNQNGCELLNSEFSRTETLNTAAKIFSSFVIDSVSTQ